MDNRSARLSYGPNRWIGAGTGGLTAIALGLALTTDDRVGRTLYVLVTVALAGIAASDLIWNPRLVADGDGIVVRSPTGTAALRWAEVQSISVDQHSRFGLASRALQIDAGERLLMVSQRALGGSDPREVVALLEALRR